MASPLNQRQQQQVRDIITPSSMADQQPVWGIVLWYNAVRNVANVLMSQPGSDATGEIYPNVPCPVNVGLQTVAPEPGRACTVMFKGDFPIITGFFNYAYDNQDYPRSTAAAQSLPRFMLEM